MKEQVDYVRMNEQEEPQSDATPTKTEEAESSFTDVVKRLLGGDRVLWVIIIALMTISVLVVYSSTAKMAYMPSSSTSPMEFLRFQLLLLIFGIVLMFGTHRINSRVYRATANLAWFAAIGLTAAVYFMGVTTNGAARWIPIFGFQFQPLEMLKIAIVMYLARQLAKRDSHDAHSAEPEVLDLVESEAKGNLGRWRALYIRTNSTLVHGDSAGTHLFSGNCLSALGCHALYRAREADRDLAPADMGCGGCGATLHAQYRSRRYCRRSFIDLVGAVDHIAHGDSCRRFNRHRAFDDCYT